MPMEEDLDSLLTRQTLIIGQFDRNPQPKTPPLDQIIFIAPAILTPLFAAIVVFVTSSGYLIVSSHLIRKGLPMNPPDQESSLRTCSVRLPLFRVSDCLFKWYKDSRSRLLNLTGFFSSCAGAAVLMMSEVLLVTP